MTWREIGEAIRNMDKDMLDSDAEVFIDDSMDCVKEGYAGLWDISGIVDAKGWSYAKGDYIRWGFITIDTSNDSED